MILCTETHLGAFTYCDRIFLTFMAVLPSNEPTKLASINNSHLSNRWEYNDRPRYDLCRELLILLTSRV